MTPCEICSAPSTVTATIKMRRGVLLGPNTQKWQLREAHMCERCAVAFTAAIESILARGRAAQAAAQNDASRLAAQKGHVDS